MKKQALQYSVAVSVSLITLVVYLLSLQNDFVNWDDDIYVFQNPHVLSFDVTFFKWAFSAFYAYNWHPFTWLSHAVDYAVWGVDPLGHHLTSIVLHALNAFLVVMLVIKLLEAFRDRAPFLNERGMLIAAGTTGLLFGLHPLHVESVAWVAERKDLLCALFFLLSIIAYTKYVEIQKPGVRSQKPDYGRNAKKAYLLTLGFFILALLSKPMAVTLPVVLLILDWHPFNRIRSFKSFRAAMIEKVPFFALSLASSIVTILAQRAGGALISTEEVPLSERLLVAVRSLISYLWNMILPQNLTAFYPYPKNISLLSIEYVSAGALVAGMTIAFLLLARKHKIWLAAWGYYVVTLIPVLGIVQVGGQAMADRYTYLPSLGPFILAGLGTAWIWGRVNTRKRGLALQFISGALAAVVFASLIYLTCGQIGVWKNSFVLWNDVIQKQPNRVPVAYINRGIVFAEMGRTDKASEDFNTAIALDPSDYLSYTNLGKLYLNNGLYEKSIEYADKAIALAPSQAAPYNNRGIAYVYTGHYDSAEKDFNKAIELNPEYAAAYYNRGTFYRNTGRKELAVEDFRRACYLGHENGCRAFYQATGGLNSPEQ